MHDNDSRSRYAGRRALVTGADGFIGSHLSEALVGHGADVRALVCYNAMGLEGWLDDIDPEKRDAIEVVAGDVRDAEQMRRVVEGCDIVFNLAALIGIPYSYAAPRSYIDTNVVGALNVLEAARLTGVERVVQTSSSEVYGSAVTVPIDEHHPLSAQSPYAASKIGADQLALSYHLSFALPVTVVRPFNTYGPRQSLRAVIPTVMTRLLAGFPDVRLGNLEPTRDFSFVADIVEGFLAVADAELTVGEVINLGSGFEISIGDTARLIAEVVGKELHVVPEESRKRRETSEVMRLFADNRKARRVAGWEPRHAGLEGFRRGLEKTRDWFAKADNLRRYRPQEYGL